MISDQSAKTYNLILTSEVIQLAKDKGVYFGFGKEQNRIRYLIKVGLLPHQIRKYSGKQVDSYLPDYVVDKLVKIHKLQEEESLKIPQIIQKFEEVKAFKERKKAALMSQEENKVKLKSKTVRTKTFKTLINKVNDIQWGIDTPKIKAPNIRITHIYVTTCILMLPLIITALNKYNLRTFNFINSFKNKQVRNINPVTENNLDLKGSVLAAKDINTSPVLEINIPINAYGQTLDLGTGSITASNIVYKLNAGSGISITGDPQNPTISTNISDETVQAIENYLVAGTGISINGGEIALAETSKGFTSWKTTIDGSSGDVIKDGDALDFISGNDILVTRSSAKRISFALSPTLTTVTNIQVPSGGAISIGGVNLSDYVTSSSGSSLIGVYTEDFTNISPTSNNLQSVLENIDQNISSVLENIDQNLGVGESGFDGSGTINYIPKMTNTTTLGNSILFETTQGISLGTVNGGNQGEFRLLESTSGGSNYTGFKAPSSLTNNLLYTLPTQSGGADYVLTWQTGNTLEWKEVTAVGSSGDITGVTAGSGLTGGGTSGSVTLNIGPGNGLTIGADNITIKLPTSQNLKNTQSYSGLEVDGDGLSLISGCSASNFLVWDGSNWICGTINDASGISNIGDVTSGDAFTATGSSGKSLYFYDPDGRGLLTIANLTAPRTYNLPDASGTFALLGSSQTFSGTNTFTENITLNRDNGSMIFNASTPLETDFWLANVNDSLGNNNDYLRIGTGTTTGTNTVISIGYDGNLGVGSTTPGERLDVAGNARFSSVSSGAYANDLNLTADGTLTTSSSDLRLKENLSPLTDATLEKVLNLKTYTFNWIGQPSNTDIGLIAQQTAKIFPEIVFTNKVDGYMGINYSRIPTLLVKAIQQQQGIILDTKETVDQFKYLPDYVTDTLGIQNSKIKDVNALLSEKASQKETEDNKKRIKEIETRVSFIEQNSAINISLNEIKRNQINASADNNWVWEEIKNAVTSDSDLIAYKDLQVIGSTTSKNLTITNKVNIGLIMIDAAQGSISSLGSKLYIQNSANSENIDIFNGLITIEKDGTIKAKKYVADVYSITEESYKTTADNANKDSSNQLYTAGRATIKAGSQEIEILTSRIAENSLVIVTPESLVEYPLAVTEKYKGEKFKIEVPVKSEKDIMFSWMIISVEDDNNAVAPLEGLKTSDGTTVDTE